jgi:hypothetical protein
MKQLDSDYNIIHRFLYPQIGGISMVEEVEAGFLPQKKFRNVRHGVGSDLECRFLVGGYIYIYR